ncbi:formimidoylglutamate deiminase [Micromonospora olivasterospora]|uniref:Formiminoglutamate deiminase n=1 Tax=Micromonospora olivasterospora TaxID=1880 RepID=A0A562IIY0_MICOL|nr:formimidoylglutamate deiminase [Micromonospora olivasterospora]TWH70808.1 formiminoglutamate deiminase [Micromonospora olivasterospora]
MSGERQRFHCQVALVEGGLAERVRVEAVDGVVVEVVAGVPPQPDDVVLGMVVPGFANAHSHAFHRELRGRTHANGGDFWQWRQRMYDVANRLTPDSYHVVAERVFKEMRDAGYTAVGEFHYLHHQPGGTPYGGHEMELALAAAAAAAGVRLVLLDTCYLWGGVNEPLGAEQQRFSDGDAHRWLDRWHRLRDVLSEQAGGLVTLGAAIHSVRAVSRSDLSVIADGLPQDVPLHAHVSEQPAENQACLEAHGLTPVGLLADHGLVSSRFSAVHATHLTTGDIGLLGDAGATIVMCPTTEADLGDGIGPAPELQDAKARLAIGSDQHAVIDPFEELSRLELDQRLRLQRRGVFPPDTLWAAGTVRGYESLALSRNPGLPPGLRVGEHWDAVEIDAASTRVRGADPWQLPLAARACDVRATIVGGRLTRPGC